jgi:hypothetical protein
VAKNTGRGSVVGNNAPDKNMFVKAKSVGGLFGKPKSRWERLKDRFFGRRITCPNCLSDNVQVLDGGLGIGQWNRCGWCYHEWQ